jgi:hypothetical protein
MPNTYHVDDKTYDVDKFSAEGQQAFRLLALAQQDFNVVQDTLTLRQAAVLALHSKVQEYLDDNALVTEEPTEE